METRLDHWFGKASSFLESTRRIGLADLVLMLGAIGIFQAVVLFGQEWTHTLRPVAEIDRGWDISDGEEVYWCPRVMLADDPDSPHDTRAFMRVDHIRSWPQPV